MLTQLQGLIDKNKKYQIIYADPPYQYRDKMIVSGVHGMIRGAESYYKTMSIADIENLPVNQISDSNCVLFLWATMPMLQEGLNIIKSWGFQYKTCGFVWIKKTKTGKNFVGMGHYTRGNAELCLIGMRGKLNRRAKNISQIIESQIREHSRKPIEVREKIVELYGDLPRIELFAREKTQGWDVLGNEVDKYVD